MVPPLVFQLLLLLPLLIPITLDAAALIDDVLSSTWFYFLSLLLARVTVLPSAITTCPRVLIGQYGAKLAPFTLYHLEPVAKHWLELGQCVPLGSCQCSSTILQGKTNSEVNWSTT